MKIINFVGHWLARRRVGIGIFVAIWLLVLCVSSLRLLFRTQVLGTSLWYWGGGGISFSLYADDLSLNRLEEQFPNDWRVKVARLAGEDDTSAIYVPLMPPATSRVMQRTRGKASSAKPVSLENGNTTQYDKLLERQPDKVLLLAIHLQENIVATFGGHIRDQKGEFLGFRSFDARAMQHAISIAERGRKLEPQNAFFDVGLFHLLLASRRDEDAFRVLSEASLKKTYDNHELDIVQSSIDIRESIRPLVLEEKRQLVKSYHDKSYDQLVSLVNPVATLMREEELRGNHAQAIKVRSDMARLLSLAMRGRTYRMKAGYLIRPMTLVWLDKSKRSLDDREPRSLQAGTTQWRQARVRIAARRFANYAQQHSQPTIAEETIRLGNEAALFVGSNETSGSQKFGLPTQLLTRIEAMEVLSAFSLLQLAILAALCAALSGVVLPMSRPELQPHDIRNSTRFSVAMGVVLTVGAIQAALLMSRTTYGVMLSPQLQFAALATIVAWLLCPFLFGALFVWAATVRRVWQKEQALKREPPRFDDESARHFNPPNYLELATTLCTSLTVFAALSCWLASLIAFILQSRSWTLPFTVSPLHAPYTIPEPEIWFLVCASLLSLAIYVGWIIKWRWFAPLALRPLLHGALRWYRQTLSIFMIVSSAFYLLFLLTSLSPRREAEARLSNYLKHGDVSYLRAK